MKCLGISFAAAIEARLRPASDMLSESVAICENLIDSIARASTGPIPLEINLESVSIRRADIEAAQSLVHFARRSLAKAGAASSATAAGMD